MLLICHCEEGAFPDEAISRSMRRLLRAVLRLRSANTRSAQDESPRNDGIPYGWITTKLSNNTSTPGSVKAPASTPTSPLGKSASAAEAISVKLT
jgi:hypothetical protein